MKWQDVLDDSELRVGDEWKDGLWIETAGDSDVAGSVVHLQKRDVADLVRHLTAWLETGSLEEHK